MSHGTPVGAALLLALAAAAPPALAQVAEEPPAAVRKSLCHGGQPAPACGGFMLTEFGLFTELVPAEPFEGPQLRAEWQMGPMFNYGARAAVGASLSVQSEPDFLFAVRGRYRRWLSPRLGLDLAPGVLFGAWGTDGLDVGDLSFSGQAGVSYRDLVGFTAQLEYTPERRGIVADDGQPLVRRVRRTHIGARLGGPPGTIAGVVVGLGYVVLLNSAW